VIKHWKFNKELKKNEIDFKEKIKKVQDVTRELQKENDLLQSVVND